MGTVTQLRSAGPNGTAAVDAFLTDLADHRQPSGVRTSPRTIRSYGTALRLVIDLAAPIGILDTAAGATAARTRFTGHWGKDKDGTAKSAPRTWNARYAAVSAACTYWRDRTWITGDPFAELAYQPVPRNAPGRVRPRTDINRLLADPRYPLRDRCLWSMLYATAARAEEILTMDVQRLDRRNRIGNVTRKGGLPDQVTWDVRTARLISNMLRDRTHGPLFVTERAAKGARHGEVRPENLTDDDRGRLGYRQALDRFATATTGLPDGPWTLHDLRRSALTHLSEDGMDVTMLMVKSGHRDIRSLAIYTKPSIEAVRRFEDAREVARGTWSANLDGRP
jgi:integrase